MRFLKKLLKAAAISFALFAVGIVLAAVIYPDTDPPDWYGFSVVLVPFAVFIFIIVRNKPRRMNGIVSTPSTAPQADSSYNIDTNAQYNKPASILSLDCPDTTEEAWQSEQHNTFFSSVDFSNVPDSPAYPDDTLPDEDTSSSEISIVTDGPEQIVSDGYYDFTRFSLQEAEKIKSVLIFVKRNYPLEHAAIGLAENSFGVLYKPGYILNDIVVQLYGDSTLPHDFLSVALAYSTKGAAFRKLSIEYFERAYPYLDNSILGLFRKMPPETIYFTFAKQYEKEHEYQTAFSLLSFGCMYLSPKDKENLSGWFLDLSKKIANPPRRRRWSPSEDQIHREKQIEIASKYFISLYWNSP